MNLRQHTGSEQPHHLPTRLLHGHYRFKHPKHRTAWIFCSGHRRTSAQPAMPGYFVAGFAATAATPAPVGTYSPTVGAVNPIADPAGTSSHVASVAPRSASVSAPRGSNGIVGPIYFAAPSPTISLTAGPSALQVTNESTDLGTADALTALSLLSAQLSGPQAADFQITGFTPDTILYELGTTGIDLSVSNAAALPPGTYSALLTVQTDQSAPFGTPGQAFAYNVTFTAVPEPGSIGVLALGLLSLARRRGTAKHGR